MDEDAVLLALGNLQGEMRGYNTRMDGLGREIGEIKTALKCKSEDCTTCRKEIDGQIGEIKKTHTGEAAIRGWKDKTLGEVGVIVGATLGVVSCAAWVVRGIITGRWF
jgi:hypothetical protein